MAGNNTLRRLSSRAVIGSFFKTLTAAAGLEWVTAISMLFGSDQKSEEYAWLGETPTLREWIGSRSAKELREFGITIENLLFEATLSVNVDDLERANRQRQVTIRIAEMARRTITHWAQLLSALILAGETAPCYDGASFFSTTHTVGDAPAQSNLLTISLATLGITGPVGVPSKPSSEAMEKLILAGTEKMVGYVDDRAEPMNEDTSALLVMHPVGMLTSVTGALRNQQLANGVDNTLRVSGFTYANAANVRLGAEPASFYLFRTDGQLSPFIRQEESAIDLKVQAEGSPEEFMNRRHLYGVDAKRNVGPARWEKAVKIKVTA